MSCKQITFSLYQSVPVCKQLASVLGIKIYYLIARFTANEAIIFHRHSTPYNYEQ